MITAKDALAKTRDDIQDLHKKIDAHAASDQAGLRSGMESAATKAKEIAADVKGKAANQEAAVKKHLTEGSAHLEAAANEAKAQAGASASKLKAQNLAMLGKVRDAAQSVSHAVAASRQKGAK